MAGSPIRETILYVNYTFTDYTWGGGRIMRFNVSRGPSQGGTRELGFVSMNKDDDIDIILNYDALLMSGEYLSTVNLTALLLSDRTTQSDAILSANQATNVEGAVVSGSTTTLVHSTNLSLFGLLPGDMIWNDTKDWMVNISSLSKTTVWNDTMNFDAAPSAAAASDAWKSGTCKFQLQAGAANTKYIVEIGAATSEGQNFFDHLLVHQFDTRVGVVP